MTTLRLTSALLFAAVLMLGAALASPTFAATKLKAVIDKSAYTMKVYDGKGTLLYNWPASTGEVSAYTPTGTWHMTGLHAGVHPSSKYGTNMYWTVYYEPADGTARRAVHGIDNPKKIPLIGVSGTSKGCVNLSIAHSKIFYNLAQQYKNSEVAIVIQP